MHVCGGCRAEFGLFCVFDGHHGRDAALHCREELLDIMMALLPNGPCPSAADPAFASFCEEVQKALLVSFLQLQHSFAVKGKMAGSTATVVLQVGASYASIAATLVTLSPLSISLPSFNACILACLPQAAWVLVACDSCAQSHML